MADRSSVLTPSENGRLNSTQGSNRPMTLDQAPAQVEREDDHAKMHVVSGGFGDSNSLDPATLKLLNENQKRVDAVLASLQPVPQEQWETMSISEEYPMESPVFDYEEVKAAPTFAIKMSKDSIYRGEIVNKKREGRGVMLYRKARVYEGFWSGDSRNGPGFERYSNGNQYEGTYRNNKPHGKGTYTWVNGEIYEGEWVNGLKEGQGVWKGIFGDSYLGDWVQSKANGYGIH